MLTILTLEVTSDYNSSLNLLDLQDVKKRLQDVKKRLPCSPRCKDLCRFSVCISGSETVRSEKLGAVTGHCPSLYVIWVKSLVSTLSPFDVTHKAPLLTYISLRQDIHPWRTAASRQTITSLLSKSYLVLTDGRVICKVPSVLYKTSHSRFVNEMDNMGACSVTANYSNAIEYSWNFSRI